MAAAPRYRWVKTWVPQPVASGNGKCSLLKWVREDIAKALEEKDGEPEETKREPTTEILFLCSFEGCGKTFIDAVALRKHAHVHGERQHVCHYEGCGKKFSDSSKLKRHFLIHTGARDFICPYEGCGKAFSLDFNLRTHMRTHSAENYRVCPYPECGKKFTLECKLNSHIKAYHDKSTSRETPNAMKHTTPTEKPRSATKVPAVVQAAATVDRPYACPYDGCDKAYIHEYKLNLHLKREHPGHNGEVNTKRNPYACPYEGCSKSYIHEYKLNLHLRKEHPDHTAEANETYNGASDHDVDVVKGENKKLKTSKPTPKMPPAKLSNPKAPILAPVNLAVRKPWPIPYGEDSEETEEEQESGEEDRWRYRETNSDEEETEDDNSSSE